MANSYDNSFPQQPSRSTHWPTHNYRIYLQSRNVLHRISVNTTRSRYHVHRPCVFFSTPTSVHVESPHPAKAVPKFQSAIAAKKLVRIRVQHNRLLRPYAIRRRVETGSRPWKFTELRPGSSSLYLSGLANPTSSVFHAVRVVILSNAGFLIGRPHLAL